MVKELDIFYEKKAPNILSLSETRMIDAFSCLIGYPISFLMFLLSDLFWLLL